MKKYQKLKVKSIKKLDEVYDRYDLTVGETSNFFANDILIHNTSAVFGNILCKKPFNIFRYLGKKIGLDVEETEHKLVYSSRTILKNRRDGKFTDDVWGVIASRLDGKIPKGFTVYGELVGYSSPNKVIQKGYDYGVKQGEVDFFVYRMTEYTFDGVRECSWDEIESFCNDKGLKYVPVYYKGKAKDMFDIPVCNFEEDPAICYGDGEPKGQCIECGGKQHQCDRDKEWREQFLTALKDKYLDKTCEFCTTGVVNEGIVLRNESDPKRTALKYKSPKFLIGESADRDKGETNMEEEN